MWTWVNQKSGAKQASMAVDGIDTYLIGPPDTDNSASMLVRALPTVPYCAIFAAKFFLPDADYATAGVILRESSSGNFKGLYHDYESSPIQPPSQQLGVGFGLNGLNVFTGSYKTLAIRDFMQWFKIANDGTNESFSVSIDGDNWIVLFSHPSGTDLIADQIGFFVNPRNQQNLPAAMLCSLISM